MKPVLFLIACLFCATGAVAQNNILRSLEQPVSGQGKVTIHQDARIAALVGTALSAGADGKQAVLKVAGYRIQVYAGNNTGVAKNEAHSIAARIQSNFPELSIYTTFISPRWICRVGDFVSIEEADAAMRRLRLAGGFKEVAIVKDQINIPL
ncbi:MAG: SPOR domain-containing protein [Mediterranea sp.]|jgi:hypothetical protein|nr:SPOR domain-containing protein [Mediterranea sp.]